MNNYFLVLFIIIIFTLRFTLKSNHYLNLLLSVEFIILALLIIVRINNQSLRKEISIIFLFLCIIIIEGVFGLALLLISSQFYGSDFFRIN